ncbi:MAG: hypothetical protein ABW007_02905 [Chitinophagaceae bacterium]
MTWFQDGVRFKLYVSTDGDFVSLGTRNEYPFVAGGAGVPAGWTKWIEAGANEDVNWTTQNGRFSISNASDTNAHNTGKYNIYRDFPVEQGHRYLLQVQAQTMDGKSSAYRWLSYQPNASVGPYSIQLPSVTPWEQLSWPYNPLTGETFIRVLLKVNPYWPKAADFKFDWGVQFQNFAIVDQLASYPDPTWREVTCDVRMLTTKYGRAKFTNRYDVGTAQIVINNNDGEFTYDPNHEWGLRPGRFLKVVCNLPGSSYDYPCFYGIIDSLTDTYTLDGKATVNVQCVDTSSLLSNTEVPTASPESTTYYSGGRFRQLYNSVGWLPQMASTDTGKFIQQPIRANGRTVRDELGLIADSEGSTFYTDRTGRLTYRERDNTTMARWDSVYAELLANCPDYVFKTKWVFPGIVANYASIAHAADQSITTTADFAFRMSMQNMMGPSQCFMSKGFNWYIKKTANAKTVQVLLAASGTVITTEALPYNDGEVFWLRVQRRNATEIRVYHCPDTGSNGIPNTASMLLLGTVLTVSGNIGTNTSPTNIGARNTGGTTDPFNGRMYRASMYASYLGSFAIDADPYLWDGMEGASAVPLSRPTGGTMSINTTDDNELIQADPTQPPTGLVTVDTVPTVAAPAIVFLQALATDWSRDRVVNDVQLANQNGSAFQWIDGDSQTKYGPRTYQRMDLLNVNDHPEYLQQRADDLMAGYTDAMLRVNSVDFRPNLSTYAWTLNMFLNDLVRVRYENPQGGWGYAVVSHVQSIQWTISTQDWQVQLLLDDAEAFNRWDAAVGTGWDEGVWDETLWDGYAVAQWSRDTKWSDGVSVWGT